MTRLRILTSAFTCCPAGNPGFAGGEDVLGWNLVKQIARFHEVWTITQTEDRESIEKAMREEPDLNINFVYIELPRWLHPLLNYQGSHQFYYYLWQVKAYFAARKLHKQWNFQLFQHITYSNDWMVSFIGALLPIPYVRGPGGGSHRTPKGLEREYTLGGRMWEKIRAVGQWLFRRDPLFLMGQSKARAILVCNFESLANIPRKWAHKAHLFPINGTSSKDLALASPVESGESSFRVLSAGTLLRIKGFSLAIKAFEEFAHRNPEAQFDIIGNGPEEPRLRTLIQDSNIGSKVSILKSMSRDKLLREMANYDVFLFPSLRDGGGAVVVEAMSAGKPVICLDNGGPGMFITEDCGIKISPTSSENAVHQLADALEQLYSDKELRVRLGKAARDRAEQVYHWDRLGEQLAETYERALTSDSTR